MLRMRLGNLGFSELSFGSFLVVIFKAQFSLIVARFWLKNYGPILPHFTVLIFVRVFNSLTIKGFYYCNYYIIFTITIIIMVIKNLLYEYEYTY